jgi:predicted DNA-binding transcriptional regulator AlpA
MRKPLYSVPELARMAGVSRDTMWRVIKRHGVCCVAIGGGPERTRWRVPLSEILEKLMPLFKSHKCVQHLRIPPLETKDAKRH